MAPPLCGLEFLNKFGSIGKPFQCLSHLLIQIEQVGFKKKGFK